MSWTGVKPEQLYVPVLRVRFIGNRFVLAGSTKNTLLHVASRLGRLSYVEAEPRLCSQSGDYGGLWEKLHVSIM